MQAVKKWWYELMPALLALLMLAGVFNLLIPNDAYAVGGSITISGPGLDGDAITITQDQLRGNAPLTLPDGTEVEQHDEWYSTINTWPTKSWSRGQGIKVIDLLNVAGGIKPEATLIKFTSSDNFSATFTLQELIHDSRYRFPNFMSTGMVGHIPGDPSQSVQVEPMIAYASFSVQDIADIADEDNFSFTDGNLLMYGQRAVTQQTNSRFTKYVKKIEVLTDPVPKWDNPTANPASGEVAAGSPVRLYGPFNDEDKVHYTVDGSNPTLESPMYNVVASRWWSSREDDLDEINRPIIINHDTTIKAMVVGPGCENSDVVTFEYRIPNINEPILQPPMLTADTTDNTLGHSIELIFNDNQSWRQAITDVMVNGSTIAGRYSVAAGVITVNPDVFCTAANYIVEVIASGYSNVVISQRVDNPAEKPPDEEVILTIKGDGVATTREYTRKQLDAMSQHQEIYSSINTWPTRKTFVGRGVKLRDLLNMAGMAGNTQKIRFIASDGYYLTLTVQELFDIRYRFPNLLSGADGHIPASSAGATVVEPILALVSAEGTDEPAFMNDMNALVLMLGQRAVTEQTGPQIVRYINEVEVLTSAPGIWDAPTAQPGGGMVEKGTKVVLHSPNDDEDKVYYTIDGSTPTINSSMYNWVAKRWWASRGEETVAQINRPIEITKDTTIKAVTIGPGKSNSNVVEFKYTVKETPISISGQITPVQGGQVSLGEKVVLDIPAGALAGTNPVDIKIERVIEPPAVSAGFRILGNVYEFSVGNETSYTFNKPVTLTLKFDPKEIGPDEIPTIYYYNAAAKKWANLGGKISNNTITVKVDHFTMFALMLINNSMAVKTIVPGEGGRVSLAEEAVIEVPAGALTGTSPVEVKIERVSKLPALPSGFKIVAGVFEFSVDKKTSYSFNKPVTVRIGFNPEQAGSNYAFAIYYYDPVEEKWVSIGGEVDMDFVTAKANHFTKYTVLAVPKVIEVNLKDIGGHWAEKCIKELVAREAIGGYPDGTFKPDNNITRSEFASIIVKAFRLETQSGKAFDDTKDHWARDSIATAAYYGIASGYDANMFGPDDYITREQMAAMIVNAAKITPVKAPLSFTDSGSIALWADEAVAAAVKSGIINGYPDNTMRPQSNATRAEAVTVIVNALKKNNT